MRGFEIGAPKSFSCKGRGGFLKPERRICEWRVG
jgi:hypothetical protein